MTVIGQGIISTQPVPGLGQMKGICFLESMYSLLTKCKSGINEIFA